MTPKSKRKSVKSATRSIGMVNMHSTRKWGNSQLVKFVSRFFTFSLGFFGSMKSYDDLEAYGVVI